MFEKKPTHDEEVFLRIVERTEHLGKRRRQTWATVVVVREAGKALVVEERERRRAKFEDAFGEIGLAALGNGESWWFGVRRHRAHEGTQGV